ncbi:PAS domain-containing sensor histidine kinase [Oceanotoga sp. DSM 15011]|uniref:sensor histidine kinase n=1 Tax=Oceanotoga sp. DSM 15011 TaxID=2984951 RepID=UPI0021F43D50|nr:PAS domain-containing sensor histidine kinase [Oceanotoga sp. DSM 15011]UYO99748.1 PAS domain-containing sensor histidine kinase [Oceanotoga sp. DSM 15011]
MKKNLVEKINFILNELKKFNYITDKSSLLKKSFKILSEEFEKSDYGLVFEIIEGKYKILDNIGPQSKKIEVIKNMAENNNKTVYINIIVNNKNIGGIAFCISEESKKVFNDYDIELLNLFKTSLEILLEKSKNEKIKHYEYMDEKLKHILYSISNDFNITVENTGRILEVSKSCKLHLGYDRKEMIGQNLLDFVSEKDFEISKKIFFSIDKNRISRNFSFRNRLISKDNYEIWLAWNWFNDLDQNKIYMVAININKEMEIYENIAKTKKLSEETLKAKMGFLSVVSHEIKTPLTGIIGALDIVKETELDEKQKKFIDIAYNSSEYLLEQVSNILLTSKIEGEYTKLNLEFHELNKIIEESFEKFDSKTYEKNISLKLDLKNTENIKIRIDKPKLIIILNNIIDNAIKFTPEGSIKILTSENEDSYTIEIIDTGIGIPDKYKSLIFDKFYQVDQTDTRINKGTGLGLSIVNNYIKILNGKIKVFDNSPKGTIFKIYLNKFI